MRTGSHVRPIVWLAALFTVTVVFAVGPARTLAQIAPGAASAGGRDSGVRQALFTTPVGGMLARQKSPYVDAHGESVVVPASYCEGCAPGGGGYYPGGEYSDAGGYYAGGQHPGFMTSMQYGPGGFNGPYPMGAGGTNPPVGYDLMGDVGMEGYMVDQRGPHYFDIRVEAVHMTPDETFHRDVDFTIFNLNGPIVLSSRDLDYDYETGFRAMGRFDIGPLSVLEFGYMGIYDWRDRASFTDPNPVDVAAGTGNLFSVFSDFGTNPANVATQFGPMPESERSITHSIAIDSQLQTAEINCRRYWVGFLPRISGTTLAGFRYTKLKEDFLFSTVGEAAMDYNLRADNDLAGFQAGGDVWIGLMQGLRIGAEGKAGIFNNRYTLRNTINTAPLGTTPPTFGERFDDNEVAFISEASVDVVADILPSWSIRAGYEILYMNSVVLAGNNFNSGSPYGLAGQDPRIPFVAEQGNQYYHGGHVGLEFIW
jgi:hypothetical protein